MLNTFFFVFFRSKKCLCVLTVMSNMKILQNINVRNHYVVQSCLVISLVTVTIWITKILRKKISHNAQQCVNDKISSIPLVIITGCDTGLGYSIVMRYLKGEHLNKNQNNSKIYNMLFSNNKALLIPNKIAIIAFCLNPNSPGAKRLVQLSLENSNIQLFVRQLNLTDNDSIKTGVTFVTDLLQQNVDIIDEHNETVVLKYGMCKI